MATVLRDELDDGALGLGSALIYPPGSFAPPDELLALSRVVERCGGVYYSHVRGEGRTCWNRSPSWSTSLG
jgi:N-acyl-D-amino-acid deacylase